MHRLDLDSADTLVQDFVRSLPLDDPEGIEIRLGGATICQVFPPRDLSDHEKEALVLRGSELVRRARERNKGIPARVLEREVRDAVNEVRRRGA